MKYIPNKEQLYRGYKVTFPVKGTLAEVGHLACVKGPKTVELRLRLIPEDELAADDPDMDPDLDDLCDVCGRPLSSCACLDGDEWHPTLEKCPRYGRGCKTCQEPICNDEHFWTNYDNLAEILDVKVNGKEITGEQLDAHPALHRWISTVMAANSL